MSRRVEYVGAAAIYAAFIGFVAFVATADLPPAPPCAWWFWPSAIAGGLLAAVGLAWAANVVSWAILDRDKVVGGE